MTEDFTEAINRALSKQKKDGELIYRGLAEVLRSEIVAGRLAAGARLPSERALAQALGIARGTIRQAIDDLVASGLLIRKQGSGTHVNRRFEKSLTHLRGFSEEMRERGMTPGVTWLLQEKALPSFAEAATLQIDRSAPVIRLKRLRTADLNAIAIEHTVVPTSFLPDVSLIASSLYDALRAQNAAPIRGRQRIRADIMNNEEAAHLSPLEGAPLLVVERLCELADGRPVEFTETRYDASVYDFSTDLHL